MNKIEENQIWEVAGHRIIIGNVFQVSVKVFSTETGKIETWTQSDILIFGNLLQ